MVLEQDATWSALGELVAQRMGLRFHGPRLPDLRRGVAAAARDLGWPDAESYARALLAAPPGPEQLQQLARHLTIGETYFFRDPQLLKAVAEQVLPAIVRSRRAGERRLRIWSAGCASGEEACTLAILLHELLPDLAQWQVTITATDLNPAALHKARAGLYGEWSFRATPPALKARYFERQADGRYLVDPRIRKLVDFAALNLVEDAYPSLETHTSAMDLVFCRNVLMYFTEAQASAAVARLRRALVEGGWLVVSPSEASQVLFAAFETVNFPGAILYRKGGTAPAVVPPAPVPASAVPDPGPAPVAAAPAPPVARPDPRAFALLARTEADQGRLEQALAWCDRWVAADKVDPAAHYLRAMVLMEQGRLEPARLALRRATFLAPGLVLAHFALGNLARREGRTQEALRHLANVRLLLEGRAAGELLPEGDGLSAGRLRQIVEVLLAPAEDA